MHLLKAPRVPAPELVPVDWAGDPAPLSTLRGRVVLINFFSFGDPEGMRALPRVEALAAQYRDEGLSVVGVHVPAYGFERPFDAARREVWRRGIPHSVALDHGLEVVRAYACQDLPARVLVDQAGFLRGWHQGPGGLGRLERAVRTLLRERTPGIELPSPIEPPSEGVRWRPTPEIRFGTRGVGFGPPFDEEPPAYGALHRFGELPDVRAQGVAYLEGAWRLGADHIVAEEAGASVSVVYEGASVYAVIAPDDGAPTELALSLTLDGGAPSADALGTDARADGDECSVSVDAGRVYELISSDEFAVHHVRIGARQAGVAFHLIEFGTIDVPEEA